jgi:hypothetical protein
MPRKAFNLSRNVDECEPLIFATSQIDDDASEMVYAEFAEAIGRGLHSFTFQLNLSRV